MKTAKVLVRVIELECPHCHEIIKASDGSISIHRDMADRWESISQRPMECTGCHRLFSLPANPFRQT